MSVKFTKPRGTYDVLPDESYKWQYILSIFRKITNEYNYKEIVTPIFEKANLFERNVGDTSDIVQKEMYKFLDKKGREFALRPEGTAPVVRAYSENNLGASGNLSRLYYVGPMFRYDRPQKGRYRQFMQYGIEAIGSDNPFIDAEIIAFAYYFLKEMGLKRFEIQINSIGCADCTKEHDKALVEFFTPNFEELCEDCKKRLKKNPKRILDCKVKTCKELSVGAPVVLDYLDENCKSHFENVKKYLDNMGVPYIVNPEIVRGLDYYTNTAFEILNNDLGAQKAIIAGGRYNKLVGQIGGKDVPGIGFAGGLERLILSMENEGLTFGTDLMTSIYIVALGVEATGKAVALLPKLRQSGMKILFDIDKTSMKAQMKAADKNDVKFSLILGDQEIERNIMILKSMKTGEQVELELENTDLLKEKINEMMKLES